MPPFSTLPDAATWRADPHKRILLFGMSGLGKTRISDILRRAGGWFHFSIDYRIGTRYMGEHIVDNFKREAMRNPFLADLLLSDSIYIASNITFNNLAPLSTYLGKPGDPNRGGLRIEEYGIRQDQHRRAEMAALLDTPHFIDRARTLYGYDHFVCDSGGSICEVIDPEDRDDPVLSALSERMLLVWLKGDADQTAALAARFDANPKPMYYHPDFLTKVWQGYLQDTGLPPDQVDPDAFIRAAFAEAVAHRQPRYAAMARNWGVTVDARALEDTDDAQTILDVIAHALETA